MITTGNQRHAGVEVVRLALHERWARRRSNLALRSLLALLLASLAVPSTHAWNAEGHMVVAQIAYNHLNPDVKAKCDALIAVPVQYAGSGNSNFVTAACWADDIKSSTSAYNIWHYIDIPFGDSAYTNNVGAASFDVVLAINQCIAVLQNPTASVSNQAMSLRFLLHFVGDIHQPLHCTTAVSSAHPTGDAGGNGFSLLGNWSNLHSLWDAGGGYLTDSVGRPLSAAGRNTLSNKVAEVEAAYPFVGNPGTIPDPEMWAEEGWQNAQDVCYTGITDGSTPTTEYLDTAMAATSEWLALAGKRLADLLNTLTPLPGQFAGNGFASAGGPIGQGNLLLTDDGTNVFGTIAKGPNALTNVLVLYIDSVAGGFASTAGFSDGSDALRRAISGFNGSSSRSTLTFSGMTPDYAIAISPTNAGFGGLWQLANGGAGSLTYVADVKLAPTGTATAPVYTFSFNVGQIGLATNSGGSFKVLGTYVSTLGSRSREALPGNVTGTAGYNAFTQTAAAAYTITKRLSPYPVPAQPAILSDGALRISFTNLTGMSFSLLGSVDPTLPLNLWSNLGAAIEAPVGSGLYQFTDQQATNGLARFFRITSP